MTCRLKKFGDARITARGLGFAFLVAASCSVTSCKKVEITVDSSLSKVAGETVSFPANAPQLSSLNVESARLDQPSVVPLSGRLMWDENSTSRVFTPFAGIVRKFFVDINQPVEKGHPLVEIQSAEFGQALAEARKAQSDFRRAERTLARMRELSENGAAPKKDVESAEADFSTAGAEKERAEMRLAIYGVKADSTNYGFQLPSPIGGVVVERNVTPGQEVRPDQMLANMPQYTAPLFVVTDPSRLWIQIDATEADLPYLRPGREFTFFSHAFPGQSFTGRVEVVSEFIDSATRTIKVRGSVANPARLFKAEMFVSVNVPGQDVSGPSVPSKAVFLKGEKHYVFVEQQPGEFTRREVQVGPERGGRMVLLAGVETGQRVVTEGCLLLQQSLK